MVLVRAVAEFTIPNSSASQLVWVAALGHNKIAWSERIFLLFATSDRDGFNLVEIKESILYIRNTEIRHFNRIGRLYPSTFGYSRSYLSDFSKWHARISNAHLVLPTEHPDEQGWNELPQPLLGLLPQPLDLRRPVQDADDPLLFDQRGKGNLDFLNFALIQDLSKHGVTRGVIVRPCLERVKQEFSVENASVPNW